MSVRIVIIDSGISLKQRDRCKKISCYKDYSSGVEDTIGHGSAVFHIIESNWDGDIEVIKVFEKDEEVNEDILIDVLKGFLKEEKRGDVVINISMGITLCNRKEEFNQLCQKLISKGYIIVSAFDNDGAVSYPAAFKGVIGVDTSRKCRNVTEFEYVESDLINIRGFSGEQNLPDPAGEFKKFSGSSFVAPYITAMIAKWLMLNKVHDLDSILEALREQSVLIYEKKELEKTEHLFTIKKAVIAPLNKEITSLIKFIDLLPFEIINVYDLRHMRTIGKKVSDILKYKLDKDFIIKNLENLDWNDDFDTLILGHMKEINHFLKEDLTEKIIIQCLKYNKKVYSFDSLSGYQDLISQKRELFQYPEINSAHVPGNQFGKMYQVHCPVLAIFGTSSKQGKYTLQLKLRKKFMQNGFKVAQLGTEPSAKLFGMDEVYPMGYNGNVLIEGYDEILTINHLINQMIHDDTDILIVGAQSQSVAYSSQNLSLFPIGNVNFLLATQPDIILLCVNIFDNDAYIKRTINYLEGMIDTQVIALMISPVMQEYSNSTLVRTTYIADMDKVIAFKNHLEETLNKKCFIMDMDDDATDIYNHCIEILT